MNPVVLVGLAVMFLATSGAAQVDWTQCSEVVPIPGNQDGLTSCASCNRGASPYYPCNDPSLCYCNGTAIPPQYLLPFSYCPQVIAVPHNPHDLPDSRCAVCSGGNYRWYPCDQSSVGVLCQCNTTGTTLTNAPITWGTGRWRNCTRVIAIPGNPHSLNNDRCGVCNYGAYKYYPCDDPSLCYCAGTPIPPEYVLPFTYCSRVVAVPGQTTASDAQCSRCNNGMFRWWPCEPGHVGVLCQCASGSTSINLPPCATAPSALLGDPAVADSVAAVAFRAAPQFQSNGGPNVDRIQRLVEGAGGFQPLFPNANKGQGIQNASGAFSYASFLQAAARFPDFCGSVGPLRSNLTADDVCALELAAFFAHAIASTAQRRRPGVEDGLYNMESPACAASQTSDCSFIESSGAYPAVFGAQYFGRGAFMMQGNLAYGEFSQTVYGDSSILLNYPQLVASSDQQFGWLGFGSGLWIYMTPKFPAPSMHDVIAGYWRPSALDAASGRVSAFATTTVIRAPEECDGNNTDQSRGSNFATLSARFGGARLADAIAPTICATADGFSDRDTTVPALYWDRDWTNACGCKLVPWLTAFSAAASRNASYPYARCVDSFKDCRCNIPTPPTLGVNDGTLPGSRVRSDSIPPECLVPETGEVANVLRRAQPQYGPAGANAARVQRLVNESYFAYLFPRANKGSGPAAGGPYTYQSLLRAVARYPDFCNSVGPQRSPLSLDAVCMLELSTLFAHFVQETGEFNPSLSVPTWRQGLYHYEEIGCAGGAGGAPCAYSQAGSTLYAPVAGRQYFGRGPFQLSWNYNYGAFSASVYGDASVLLAHPEYVASVDPQYSWLAFASALWFYMTPQAPKPSMHDVVAGHWMPSTTDVAQGRTSSFGATTMIINGALECGAGTSPKSRGSAFVSICGAFGLDAGACAALSPMECQAMLPFSATNSTVPSLYWDRDWSASCRCRLVSWATAFFAAESPDLSVPYLRCVNSIGGTCPRCAVPAVVADLPVGPLGNTMATFGIGTAPTCGASVRPANCSAPDYAQVLCMSMSFYMVQSGGRNVAGQEWRRTCFPGDGSQPAQPAMPVANLSLGWLDAGDTMKYGLPMAFSAMALAWGALEFPDGYAVGSEQRTALLYNLRTFAFYILAGWDPTRKELVAQIGLMGQDHSSWKPCYARNDPRPVYRISPTCPGTEVAAETASALAAIAILLKRFEGSYSATLQQDLATAAGEIFDLGDSYRGVYTGCVSDAGGAYASYSGYNDELSFAATWMRSLQLEGLLNAGVDFLAKARATYSSAYNLDWDNKYLGTALKMYELTREDRWAQDVTRRVNYYVNEAPRTRGGLLKILMWGSLRYAANAAFVARLARKLGLGDDSWVRFAQQQLDYTLGFNPPRRSYAVGYGEQFPQFVHHRNGHDNLDGNIGDPNPNKHTLYGALIGGPFNWDYEYVDARDNYVLNQVASDYNALWSGLLASFVGVCQTTTTVSNVTLAPAGVPSVVGFSLSVVLLQEWWVQIILSPRPAAATMTYNGNEKVTMYIPSWGFNDAGDHWVGKPKHAIDTYQAISIQIFDETGASKSYTIKEGSIMLTVSVTPARRRAASTPATETVRAAAALTLNVDPSRVEVSSVSTTLVQVIIRPLPMGYYTTDGRARGEWPGAPSTTNNTVVAQVLEDEGSTTRRRFLDAIGGDSISSGPAPPPPSPVCLGSSCQSTAVGVAVIVLIVVGAGVLFLAGFYLFKQHFGSSGDPQKQSRIHAHQEATQKATDDEAAPKFSSDLTLP